MDKRTTCAGCERKEAEATFWCIDCSELLCINCSKVHAKLKIFPHKVVPAKNISNFRCSILNQAGFCEDHIGNGITSFCIKDDRVLCTECIKEEHKHCDWEPIKIAAQNVKSGTAITDVKTRVDRLFTSIQDIIGDISRNLSDLLVERENIEKEIENIRRVIDEHLDKIQNELKTELGNIYDNCRKVNEEFKTELEELLHQMESRKEHFHLLEENSSDETIFCALKMFDIKVKNVEDQLQTFQETMKLNKLEFSASEQSFPKAWSANQIFGTIDKNEKLIRLDRFHFQGQTLIRRKHYEFEVQVSNSDFGLNMQIISGCFVNTDKLLLLSLTKPYLFICNIDASEGKEIGVKSEPQDVAVYQNEFAFATFGNKGVGKINLATLELSKMKLRGNWKSCKSISCCGDLILVRTDEKKISFVDTEGKISNTIDTSYVVNKLCLAESDKMYYTTFNSNVIYCLSSNGDNISEITCDTLEQVTDMAYDADGSIYVLDNYSDGVFKISCTAQRRTCILSKKDGLSHTYGLAYDKENRRLMIICLHGMSVWIFRMNCT